jgi:hypothetical protein
MAKNNTPKIIPETAASVAGAKARGKALEASPFALMHAAYNARTDVFAFTLRDDTQFLIPRANIGVGKIAKATPEQLKRVEIDAFRTHAWFPDVDEGINPVGMFAQRFNSALQAERGRAGGRKRSAAKSIASKENGKKGGRPRKRRAVTV